MPQAAKNSLPVPPLTWDGDDRARVTELLKGLSEWLGYSCTYPLVKGVSTCISVIPWLCREGPGDFGHGLAPGHHLVMQACCAVSSRAHSYHWRARSSRLAPRAAGARYSDTLHCTGKGSGCWGCWGCCLGTHLLKPHGL